MSEMEYGSDEHLDGLSRNALKTEVRWWHDRANEMEGECERLQADNAKLRDELAKARDPQRIGGQADPSSFVYAIEQLREFRWQHATNDEDAIPYINNVAAAHERENAKLREQVGEACMQLGGAWVRCTELRELVRVMAYCMQCERDCDGCAMSGADGAVTEPAGCDGLRDRMRELGVEVER